MHSKITWLLVCVLVLGTLVRQGFSLKCYNCIGCNDHFKSTEYEDSTSDCSGSCQKLKVNDLVTRNCLPLLQSDNCEEEGDNAACHCTTDLCNSALKTQISGFAVLFVSISLFLRKYLF